MLEIEAGSAWSIACIACCEASTVQPATRGTQHAVLGEIGGGKRLGSSRPCYRGTEPCRCRLKRTSPRIRGLSQLGLSHPPPTLDIFRNASDPARSRVWRERWRRAERLRSRTAACLGRIATRAAEGSWFGDGRVWPARVHARRASGGVERRAGFSPSH